MANTKVGPLKNFYLVMETVTGAAADTDIAVADIRTTDTLMAVIEHDATSALPTDQTGACSITEDGIIQCTNTTATDTLIVWWVARDQI